MSVIGNRARAKKAPILEALEARQQRDSLGFHMPGHQRGQGLWPEFVRLLKERGAALDLTELPGLDMLGTANGCIAQSEDYMAQILGAKKTFYLVNGATAGLEAAILAMTQPEKPVLLPAHSHMSLLNGMVLSGCRPMILPAVVDEEWGLPLGADPAALTRAEVICQDWQLLITVNPTYHGVIADMLNIYQWLGRNPHTAWLVDEAHGAHLPFLKLTRAWPKGGCSSLGWKAEAVVQSTHKMGGSLTQTALLHVNDERLVEPVQRALNMLQSSSPSYLLMGSLDAYQAMLQEEGPRRIEEAKELAMDLTADIRKMGCYEIWQDRLPVGYICDPCKLTIRCPELGLTGKELADILLNEYHIDVEMATREHVLFMITMGHKDKDLLRLGTALLEIRDKHKKSPAPLNLSPEAREVREKQRADRDLLKSFYNQEHVPLELKLSPREAFFIPRELVPLSEAPGRIAAEEIVPYPPGVPLLYPGMKIEKQHIEGLLDWLKLEGRIVGLKMLTGQPAISVLKDRWSR
ncbi:MAG: hypothetical protein VB085_07690 [Peptococcaceae bacterium]|nr:hypothetical protein [Peptococcaceae bacterium]